MLSIINEEQKSNELTSEVIESLIEFLLKKLSLPFVDILVKFLVSGFQDFYDLPSGEELYLSNSGEEFMAAFLQQQKADQKKILDLEKELAELRLKLPEATFGKQVSDSEFRDLKEAVLIADGKFRAKYLLTQTSKAKHKSPQRSIGYKIAYRHYSDFYRTIFNLLK